MYEIKKSSLFKRKIKKYKHNIRVLKKLEIVAGILISGKNIPEEFLDHELSGNLKPFRELHLFPDELLIYDIDKKNYIITLVSIGNHNNIF